MSKKKFVEYVKAQLSETNTKFQLVDAPYIVDDGEPDIPENRCSGFFDEENRRLVVATKKPEHQWFGILCHEFAHYQQWFEGYDFADYEECQDDFEAYTQGANVTRERVFEAIKVLKRVEHDAERRVIEMAKEWDLPIDCPEYIQAAQAFLTWFDMVAHTRQRPERRIYDCPEICDCFPALDELPSLGELPHFSKYEKLYYVFGFFYPPRKRYEAPGMSQLVF